MATVKKINLRRTSGRKAACIIQPPIVKRISSHPVTLQGWLQKRGSDGLMLWKKRWFVLSDYCLFYYKDQEEEVLLGSFVLASWIISPCTHKDKVYKKYSFKAEHNNMRTYYFATDNDIIMAQWLKALTMASLLQESPRPTSKINNSQMNQFRPKDYHVHKPPPHVSYNDGFSSRGRAMNPDEQPLYVNAPPKPKRLNDGPTPDLVEEEARMSVCHEATRSYDETMNVLMAHGRNLPSPNNKPLHTVLPINDEKAGTSRPPSAIFDLASHYECLRTSYTVNQVSGNYHPPRPRSVDFLEFEHKHPQDTKNAFEHETITLPRRPKSSMSISTPKDEECDLNHWSEESYAKKMRESSMYVRPDNDNSTGSMKIGSSLQERDITSQSTDEIDSQGTVKSTPLLTDRRQNSVSSMDVNVEPNIFKRSASARLPEPDNEPYGHAKDAYNVSLGTIESKKIQQREESMKRLLEWKQRMLQTPIMQKHNEEFGEAENLLLERTHRPQEIRTTMSSSNYHDPNFFHHMDNGVQPGLENYSAHDHLYSTSPNVQAYNNYQLQSQDPRVGHVEQVSQLMNDIVVSKGISAKGENEYKSPSEYSTVECSAPFSDGKLVSNQLPTYTDDLEPRYSAVLKHSSVPSDLPGPKEGPDSTKPFLDACNTHKSGTEIDVYMGDEEWGLKLDEASVVKEFSYHYVRNEGAGGTSLRAKSIKSSHSEMGRGVPYKAHGSLHSTQSMPENYPVNEEHETNTFKVDEKQQSSGRSSTLPIGILKNIKNKKKLGLEKYGEEANLKWEQSYSTDIHDKRQVFSDTETLLYETSSDADFKEGKDLSSKLTIESSDDDRDDEVAAVLAKEHELSHACLPESASKTPINMCPPSNSFICSSDENVPKNNDFTHSENVAELSEENYMTMTPRKMAVSASPLKDSEQCPISSPVSNMEDNNLKGIEECPYVEMTQTRNAKTGSSLGTLQPTNYHYKNQDPTRGTFVEPRRSRYKSEYDVSGQEPLYMEVNSAITSRNHECQGQMKPVDLDAEEDDLRDTRAVSSALPDILNTTSPSFIHHGSRRSDSSDADDEASKDLDSIDAPRHPRFSLSDTFRPASYYLGSSLSERAIIALNSDHPDSSDSDLVSPPPIPACSPPLDDLDTSIDSTIDNKELCLNSCKEDFHKSSITEEKLKYRGLSKMNLPDLRDHLETGSSEEESLKSERPSHLLKRRPLSADILNCLGDFNMLDTSPSRVAVKDIKSYETYQETFSSGLNERPSSNRVMSPSLAKETDFYNPYRKNEFSKNIKLFYDWNQHSPGERVSRDSRVVNNLRDIPMKDNYDNMMHSPDKKCIGDSKMYNSPLPDPNSIHYGTAAPIQCLDDMSPYANANVSNNSIQNNAPYYYSDLFKVDSKNSLHRMNKSDDQLQFDRSHTLWSYSEDGTGLNSRDGYIEMVNAANKEEGMKDVPTITYSFEDTKRMIERQNLESSQKKMITGHHHSYSYTDETRLENYQRSRSLEGLLDSGRLNHDGPPPPSAGHVAVVNQPILQCTPTSAEYDTSGTSAAATTLSISDHIAMENVPKKVYVRHSRSMDHLDKKPECDFETDAVVINKKEALYANSEFSASKGQDLPNQRSSADKAGSGSYSGAQARIDPPLDGHQSTGNSTDDSQKPSWDLKLSAGDLLGRTHEELVLLLIQLRRQRAAVCKAMERCHREIEAHACLTDFDSIDRPEHVLKLDELKSRLIELEKQYEKGKPLVNLVDNMVKLGSLYQSGPQAIMLEKLEFNHKVQEQRILADERRDWERIRADHQDLQGKVEQLYRLDKLLQEESGTLHSLQEDKGVLERALEGLKLKLQGVHGNTAETEWYRRQQRLLERELSRVRSILALNSKKLEETVAENARLEQELVVLRQKLQLSRRTTEPGGAATVALESELCRVQLLVGNLLRQRQELSSQVRQLTEKSNSLSQQIWPSLSDSFVGTTATPKKKSSTVGWIETDLDLGGTPFSANNEACCAWEHTLFPLYVNTNDSNKQNAYYGEHTGFLEDHLDEISPLNARSSDTIRSDLEDSKRACGSVWREKPQEIKTVRIVKRESERRQRDRDHRSGNIGIPLMCSSKRVIPEEVALDPISEKRGTDSSGDAVIQVEASEPPPTPGPRSDSVQAVWNIVRKNKLKGNMLGGGPVEDVDPPDSVTDSPQLSPVYLSEAARKIVEEVAWQGRGEKRAIPRERRRHHTVSGLSIIAPKHLFSQRGSRDDLDMERVLRPRLTTPDVVRSTLNRTDTSFTKETIDNILGAPGKIDIPERYIPESQPQLSKEEIMKRYKKAESIRKMLCETTTVAAKEGEVKERTNTIKHQVEEEKRNREHLLQLSQILAQEVMEKSKIVAIQALASLPSIHSSIEEEYDSDDSSPTSSLPLYQQRENFFS